MMNDENRIKAIYRYADPFFMFMETCDALKADNATSIGMQNFSANDFELVNGKGDGPYQSNYVAGDLWMRVIATTRHLLAHLPFLPEEDRKRVAGWVMID